MIFLIIFWCLIRQFITRSWIITFIVTVILRILVFPLVIVAQRNAAVMSVNLPEMTRLQAAMSEARQVGDQLQGTSINFFYTILNDTFCYKIMRNSFILNTIWGTFFLILAKCSVAIRKASFSNYSKSWNFFN